MPAHPHPLARPFVAELLGTLVLTAVVATASVGVSLYPQYTYLFVPLLAGMVVAVLVAVLGPVSGAHYNPAVSLGLWAAGRLAPVRLLLDLVAQIIGAVLGVALARHLIGAAPTVSSAFSPAGFLGEACGAFILVATVAAASCGRLEKSTAPLYVGMALTAGITLALGTSGGILNPAIAFAFGARQVGYLLGPLIGGAVAAPLVLWLFKTDVASERGSRPA